MFVGQGECAYVVSVLMAHVGPNPAAPVTVSIGSDELKMHKGRIYATCKY